MTTTTKIAVTSHKLFRNVPPFHPHPPEVLQEHTARQCIKLHMKVIHWYDVHICKRL